MNTWTGEKDRLAEFMSPERVESLSIRGRRTMLFGIQASDMTVDELYALIAYMELEIQRLKP